MSQVYNIVEGGKDENGFISEEEQARITEELQKLGIKVNISTELECSVDMDESVRVEEVQIHPWAEDENGRLFNPWCSDKNGKDAGWNVHSFASAGEGDIYIIDDVDFDDYDTAIEHAKALAEKYGVPLHRRTALMIG